MSARVLHLLPRVPGTFDGVGDYALNLARRLRELHEIDSIFVARDAPEQKEIDSFRTLPLEEPGRLLALVNGCDGVVLHYVNYGFQKRGVPTALVSFVKRLRGDCGAALLVIFHELFATGPPWRSEFWLRPLQKKFARDLARTADARLASCESTRRQLDALCPNLSAVVQPVASTWGEPTLDSSQLRDRDPHCWIICGGTVLLERSLRSFLSMADRIPTEIAPRKLFLIGGAENQAVQAMLGAARRFSPEYFPAIAPAAAAAMFCRSAFAWIDYFVSSNVPTDVLLKSSTFAALCAYGVVCVMPQASGTISIKGDALPGPFTFSNIPVPAERVAAANATYRWYHRHASSTLLASTVAQQLQLA